MKKILLILEKYVYDAFDVGAFQYLVKPVVLMPRHSRKFTVNQKNLAAYFSMIFVLPVL